MDKRVEKDYFGMLRRSTDSRQYIVLVDLLNGRLATIKDQLVNCEETESKRLQGRAQELQHIISGLTRKALKKQPTGAFN